LAALICCRDKEHHTLPESYLKAQLAGLLAGRAAEKLLRGFGQFRRRGRYQARHAPRAVDGGRLGHVEAIGPIDLRASEEHPFLGQSIAQPRSFDAVRRDARPEVEVAC
jgi:cell division protease FtsH